MQFRLLHIFVLMSYAAVSLAAYMAIPQAIGAEGIFGKLGTGFVLLGLFMCLIVIYFLRLPLHLRSSIHDDNTVIIYDGQHWLDFLIIWIIGALFVFIGGYATLADISNHPIPKLWWIPAVPATILIALYFPVWKYLRTN